LRALWRTCGLTASPGAPEASAKKICRPAMPRRGSTTTNSAITPSPPNHCDMARHRKKLRGYAEKSVRTVAPVVVKPDIDSNSAASGVSPKNMYGIAPNSPIVAQAPKATPSASLR
jgi:hypothetical protein